MCFFIISFFPLKRETGKKVKEYKNKEKDKKKKKMRKLIGFNLILLIIFIQINFIFNSSDKNSAYITIILGKKAIDCFKNLIVRSRLECISLCLKDINCKVVNFMDNNISCSFCNSTKNFQNDSFSEILIEKIGMKKKKKFLINLFFIFFF